MHSLKEVLIGIEFRTNTQRKRQYSAMAFNALTSLGSSFSNHPRITKQTPQSWGNPRIFFYPDRPH